MKSNSVFFIELTGGSNYFYVQYFHLPTIFISTHLKWLSGHAWAKSKKPARRARFGVSWIIQNNTSQTKNINFPMVFSFLLRSSFWKTDIRVSRTTQLSAVLALPGNCAALFPGNVNTELRAVVCNNHTFVLQYLCRKCKLWCLAEVKFFVFDVLFCIIRKVPKRRARG